MHVLAAFGSVMTPHTQHLIRYAKRSLGSVTATPPCLLETAPIIVTSLALSE